MILKKKLTGFCKQKWFECAKGFEEKAFLRKAWVGTKSEVDLCYWMFESEFVGFYYVVCNFIDLCRISVN